MKAVTVFEDEDGDLFVVTGESLTFSEGISLLHRGISDLVKGMQPAKGENDDR